MSGPSPFPISFVPVPAAESIEVLAETEWRTRQRAHETRVRAWTDPHQERAARGEKHPVYDFLFDYYSYRPAWLRRWHPGPDVVLAGGGAREFLRRPEYRETSDGVMVDPAALPPKRRDFVAWLRDLLAAMQARPAFFGCHGLHEWAMVYRLAPEEIRHPAWPLRLPPAELAHLLESLPLRCTHFDAFRFFTPAARLLNRGKLSRASAPEDDQRGCLHANMDLYKWAFKLAPFAPGELVADCFALARDIREVDMRASPYDLAAIGFAPIKIESCEGRIEYEQQQRGFARRAEPLRARLTALCGRLLEIFRFLGVWLLAFVICAPRA
jgi:hypothetical protein